MFIVIIKLVLLAVPQARENVEVRCTFAFLPRSSQDRHRKQVSAAVGAVGDEVARGGQRLLKFDVCWDAAVWAVSAGGFFSVWDGVRKTNVWHGARKTSDWRPVLSA